MTDACPDKLQRLQALIDGELDAANALELEAHLETCEGCAREMARMQAVRAALARPGVRHSAPPGLRARIDGALAREGRVDPDRRFSATPWRRAAPFAAGAVAAIAASLVLVAVLPLSPRALPREVVADHVRSLLAEHLVDVVSTDRHTVKPWFAGRIDYAPPVVDLKDQGFALVGGRLDYLDGRVAAALVYRRRLHVINVFVRPAKGPLGGASGVLDGYNLLTWRQGGLEFWAVSDLAAPELQQFRDLFEAQARG
jgi:anti-sigma factor (TIGR02949 family)